MMTFGTPWAKAARREQHGWRDRRTPPSMAIGARRQGRALADPGRRWRARRARAFEGFGDAHPAAATRATAHWRRSFGVPVRFGARALGRGEQLAGALDVAGSNRAGDEAVVADAVEAARQDVQEESADELGAVERQHRGKAGIRWMLGGPCDIDMIVPIDLLPPILGDLLTYCGVNKLVRPWLGIYSVESGGEVVIAAMADHRPATAAGLRHGDILASVRGAEIADVGDFYGKVWR